MGLYVFPCHTPIESRKCTCHRSTSCTQVGKHPRWHRELIPNGHKSATTDPNLIKEWFKLWPKANLAIATGQSGILVVDVDPRSKGDLSLYELARKRPFPKTLTAETGSLGIHLFYRFFDKPDKIPKLTKTLAPGIDLKGLGGYVIAPPSLHRSGNHYSWAAEREIARVPLWIIEEHTISKRTYVINTAKQFPRHPLLAKGGGMFGPPPLLQLVYEELGEDWYGNGTTEKVPILCPWEDEHSTEGGIDSSTVFFQGGQFCCLHGHCENRRTPDALSRLKEIEPKAYAKALDRYMSMKREQDEVFNRIHLKRG